MDDLVTSGCLAKLPDHKHKKSKRTRLISSAGLEEWRNESEALVKPQFPFFTNSDY